MTTDLPVADGDAKAARAPESGLVPRAACKSLELPAGILGNDGGSQRSPNSVRHDLALARVVLARGGEPRTAGLKGSEGTKPMDDALPRAETPRRGSRCVRAAQSQPSSRRRRGAPVPKPKLETATARLPTTRMT